VLLHSRINNLTQTYTFSNLSSDSAAMTSGSDPTLLGLAVDGMGQTLQVMMEPCPFEAFVPSNIRSFGQAYLARGLSFYKLFILQSDLSIHETIVYTQNSVDIKDSVEDILWTKFDQRRKAVRTKVGAGEFDDFLDLSGIHRTEFPVSKLPLQLPTRFERTTMNTVHRVSDYRLIYDALTRVRLAGEATMASTDIPNVTAQLSQLLAASSELSQLPLGTL
jgi:RNA polymerase I-specific transcription initiation factor RRN6